MNSKYAYFVWTVMMITTWLSFIVSAWLVSLIDEISIPNPIMWFLLSFAISTVPWFKDKDDKRR